MRYGQAACLGVASLLAASASVCVAVSLIVAALRATDGECGVWPPAAFAIGAVVLLAVTASSLIMFSVHITVGLKYGGKLSRSNRRAYHSVWIAWIVMHVIALFAHAFAAFFAAVVFLRGGLPTVDEESNECELAQAFGFAWTAVYGIGVLLGGAATLALGVTRFPRWLAECRSDDCFARYLAGDGATDSSGAFLDDVFSSSAAGAPRGGRGGRRFETWGGSDSGDSASSSGGATAGHGGYVAPPPFARFGASGAARDSDGAARSALLAGDALVEESGSMGVSQFASPPGEEFTNPLAQRAAHRAAPAVPTATEGGAGEGGVFRAPGGFGAARPAEAGANVGAAAQSVTQLKLQVRALRRDSQDEALLAAERARLVALHDAKLAEMRAAIHTMAAAGGGSAPAAALEHSN